MKNVLDKLAQLADELDAVNAKVADQVDQLLTDLKADYEMKKAAELEKTAFIRKKGDKWCVVSKKGKNMGCFSSRKKALVRLKQIEFFKHNK
jgi:hypothetical protein